MATRLQVIRNLRLNNFETIKEYEAAVIKAEKKLAFEQMKGVQGLNWYIDKTDHKCVLVCEILD